MKDMFGMLKKAQEMQKKMGEVQAELAASTVEGKAQSLVTVVMSGAHEVQSVKIAPEAAEDVAMLEDLIVVACKDALKQANALAESKMKAVTGGLPLPF